MKNYFNNQDLQRHTEKHLNADTVTVKKSDEIILDKDGSQYWIIDVNDDGYFYPNTKELNEDYALAIRLFSK